MQNENRIYRFIGLAMKAGQIISGSALCENALKNRKVYTVVLANDAADETVNRFMRLCNEKLITPIRFGNKEELGYIIGKAGSRSVLCITCESFAKRLQEMVSAE